MLSFDRLFTEKPAFFIEKDRLFYLFHLKREENMLKYK
ncbi:hypothetical protein SD78_0659 [Bacillus badius]|nr:hypothetical protein SD78_0659 [Bacillus badius]TDW04178.1 hypothetical protein B0G66_103479 [Bacillus badius]